MSNTTTPNAKFLIPATNDRGWDVPLRADLLVLDVMSPVGWLFVAPTENPSASLNVTISPGWFRPRSGVPIQFAGSASLGLTASTVAYVYLTDAGVLTAGTAWPAAGTPYIPLAVVAVGSAAITSIADSRLCFGSVGVGNADNAASYLVVTSDAMLPSARTLTAVANQTTITDGGPGGLMSVGTVQPIGSTSSPTFARVTITNTPTNATDSATKTYVDMGDAANANAATAANANANARVSRSGDTLTGPLITAGLGAAIQTVNANYTLQPTDQVLRVDATNGAVTITLPAATSVGHQTTTVKKVDSSSNTVTIQSTSSIDGQASFTLNAQYAVVRMIADAVSNTWGVY